MAPALGAPRSREHSPSANPLPEGAPPAPPPWEPYAPSALPVPPRRRPGQAGPAPTTLNRVLKPLLLPAAARRGGVERRSLPQIELARADAQHLVTTRLLDCLHDPARQPSRLQVIYPHALRHCNAPARRSASLRSAHGRPGRIQRPGGLICIRLQGRAGQHPPFPAWILT